MTCQNFNFYWLQYIFSLLDYFVFQTPHIRMYIFIHPRRCFADTKHGQCVNRSGCTGFTVQFFKPVQCCKAASQKMHVPLNGDEWRALTSYMKYSLIMTKTSGGAAGPYQIAPKPQLIFQVFFWKNTGSVMHFLVTATQTVPFG